MNEENRKQEFAKDLLHVIEWPGSRVGRNLMAKSGSVLKGLGLTLQN